MYPDVFTMASPWTRCTFHPNRIIQHDNVTNSASKVKEGKALLPLLPTATF